MSLYCVYGHICTLTYACIIYDNYQHDAVVHCYSWWREAEREGERTELTVSTMLQGHRHTATAGCPCRKEIDLHWEAVIIYSCTFSHSLSCLSLSLPLSLPFSRLPRRSGCHSSQCTDIRRYTTHDGSTCVFLALESHVAM